MAPPTRPSLKERQRQERETLILDAAESFLAAKGYHDTSMEEIAAQVGISKGTVYLHFPSKDDLVLALFERELAHYRQRVEQAATAAASAQVRLERLLRYTYAELRGQRAQLFLTLYANLDVRKGFVEKRLALRDHIAQVAGHITAVLDDGKSAGEFDPSIPTPIMLTTFLGLLSRHGHEHLLDAAQFSPEDLATHVGRIFFRGISAATFAKR
jgi:AcrR family transcriptional regulator